VRDEHRGRLQQFRIGRLAAEGGERGVDGGFGESDARQPAKAVGRGSKQEAGELEVVVECRGPAGVGLGRVLLPEPVEGRLMLGDEALSEREILSASGATRRLGELGPEGTDVIFVEGVARVEIGDDLRHELLGDVTTGHGNQSNGGP
jgi:hypothetical protein